MKDKGCTKLFVVVVLWSVRSEWTSKVFQWEISACCYSNNRSLGTLKCTRSEPCGKFSFPFVLTAAAGSLRVLKRIFVSFCSMKCEQTKVCLRLWTVFRATTEVVVPANQSLIPCMYLKKCIICQADKRQKPNHQLVERLAFCEGDTTPATLCYIAKVRQDERILMEIDHQHFL